MAILFIVLKWAWKTIPNNGGSGKETKHACRKKWRMGVSGHANQMLRNQFKEVGSFNDSANQPNMILNENLNLSKRMIFQMLIQMS